VTSWGAPPAGQPSLSNVVTVAAGLYHGLALTTAGTILDWGANESGEGVAPAGLTNVTALAAGWSYSLALSAGVVAPPPLAPVALIAATLSSNTFSVTFQGQNGIMYQLQFTTNLGTPTWSMAETGVGAGTNLTLEDSSATNGQRFYRVAAQN